MTATSAPPIAPGQHEPRIIPLGLDKVVDRLLPALPKAFGEDIEAVLKSNQHDICEPLLTSRNKQELEKTFKRIYPSFAATYVDLGIRLCKHLGGKNLPILWEVPATLVNKFKEDGPARIGEKATNQIILGLNAVYMINRAFAHREYSGEAEAQSRVEQGFAFVAMTAYLLANSMVMTAITFYMGQESTDPVARRNVKHLSQWAYEFAIRGRESAGQAKLLRVPSMEGRSPRHDEAYLTDDTLAEVALDDLVQEKAA